MSAERDRKITALFEAVKDGVTRNDVPPRRRVARVIRVLADLLDSKLEPEIDEKKDGSP